MMIPPLGCLTCDGNCVLNFNIPCIGEGAGSICFCKNPRNHRFIFPGDVETVYSVPTRVLGLIEPKVYTGGTFTHNWLTIDATPAPAPDSFNIYSLKLIGDTPYIAYLNKNHGVPAPDPVHPVYPIDYTETLKIRGQSCVSLIADTVDNIEIRNPDAIPNCVKQPQYAPICAIRPPPEAGSTYPNFLGQFLQVSFDCTVALPPP